MFRKIVVTILTLVAVLTLGVSLVGCNDNVSDDVVLSNVGSEVVEDVHVDQVTAITPTLRLTDGFATLANNSKSKVITATVYPSDAYNKGIDWSVSWGDKGGSNAVTNYITLTPNGSSCTVTCIRSFNSSYTVLVKATSLDNANIYATCTVTYAGLPEDYEYYLGFDTSYYYYLSEVCDLTDFVKYGTYVTFNGLNSLGIGSGYSTNLEFVSIGGSGNAYYNGGAVSMSSIVNNVVKGHDVSGAVCSLSFNSSLSNYITSNYGTYTSTDGYFYVTLKDNANNGSLITMKFVC